MTKINTCSDEPIDIGPFNCSQPPIYGPKEIRVYFKNRLSLNLARKYFNEKDSAMFNKILKNSTYTLDDRGNKIKNQEIVWAFSEDRAQTFTVK